MRIKIAAMLALLIGFIGVGCGHSQVPPVSLRANFTWQAPTSNSSWAGCTTAAPCSYIISTLVVPAGTSTCPTPSSTVVYTPLNASNPTTSLTFRDTTDTGTVCGIAQTAQSGSVSNPSAPSSPVVVPPSPLPPNITGNVAMLEKQKRDLREREALAKYSHSTTIPAPNPQSR